MSAHTQHYFAANRATPVRPSRESMARWFIACVAAALGGITYASMLHAGFSLAAQATAEVQTHTAPRQQQPDGTTLTALRVEAYRAGYAEAMQQACGPTPVLALPVSRHP